MSENNGAPQAGAGVRAAGSSPHCVYYGCKYAPVELLAGFGATTRQVSLEPDSFEAAERLAHGNLCGFGKAVLAQALDPDVHEMVLTTCCDVMRRVYDVLRAEKCLDFLWLVDLPHKTGPAERGLLRRELRRLAGAYASYTGSDFDASRALAAVDAEAAVEPPAPGSVALVGAHAPESLVHELDEELGTPVVNHTCTGPRLLAHPPLELARAAASGCGRCAVGEDAASADDVLEHFIDWYADALLDQTPCMRMLEVGGRSGLVAGGHPGIVYHTMKFCDYYGFEYSDLAAEQPSGDAVPILKIETDGTRQSSGQLRTRIEAFAETLAPRVAGSSRPSDSDSTAGRGAGGASPHAIGSAAHSHKNGAGVGHPGGYVLGVDSGSTSTDAVVMDLDGNIVASVIGATGAKASRGASKVVEDVLAKAGISRDELVASVATGYGRDSIPNMDMTVTEITCHAAGAHRLDPEARTVIDIGGQDSKVIHLDEDGSVTNFVMNDKCAAGTGRFLEAMARTLEMPIGELSREGLGWKHDVTISSMCTVFAESEVVSLIADDTPTPDIIHGLDMSVAHKTAALAKRVGGEPPYLMTGGVANNEGVVKALSDVLGTPVATHEDSQLCGAIGAAVLGLESLRHE